MKADGLKQPPHCGVYARLAPSRVHGVGVFAVRPIGEGTPDVSAMMTPRSFLCRSPAAWSPVSFWIEDVFTMISATIEGARGRFTSARRISI